ITGVGSGKLTSVVEKVGVAPLYQSQLAKVRRLEEYSLNASNKMLPLRKEEYAGIFLPVAVSVPALLITS
ncbi:hypothetical protein, partial [Klebsiella pneumoniae]|uniref:hypothetical protein n=1 Tax=Klebsiella pneumoniae TaxID=573 RepID=UPI00272F3DD0